MLDIMRYFLCLLVFLLGFADYWESSRWITLTSYRNITSISESNKFIYVSSPNGFVRWDKDKEQWLFPYTWQDLIGEELAYESIVSGPNILIRTSNGIYAIREKYLGEREPVYTELPFDRLTRDNCPDTFPLYIPPPGYIFKQEGIIMTPNFNEYAISFCHEDWSGKQWLGTWGDGVWRADPRSLRMKPLPVGLATESVYCMFTEGDEYWFGSDNPDGGITLWKKNNSRWEYFESRDNPFIPTNVVNDITTIDSTVYFATPNGLLSYNKQSATWRWIHSSVFSGECRTLINKNDTLFVGTEDGVSILCDNAPEGVRITEVGFPAVNKFTIWNGRLYAASDEGGFWFNGKFMVQIHTPDGYLKGEVWATTSDSDGVWFVSDLGLLHYNQKTEERSTWAYDAYINSLVYDMVATDRYVWLATENGVLKLRKEDEKWFSYSPEDGLAGNPVYHIVPDGDYIWFGTSEGATRFFWNDPSRVDW